MFSWDGKVTARTSLASLIWNPGFWFAAVLTVRIQFLGHFNWRLTSQSTKVFQLFYKNDLDILMEPLFQHRWNNGSIKMCHRFLFFPLFAV